MVSASSGPDSSLRRHARVGSLWALGVGAVISGDFFGWNFGLGTGGFGGMLVATLLMTLMYLGLCFSIAEMAAALPHAGGAYSFTRAAFGPRFGPWGGWITGLAEGIEYVLTPAVIVVGLGGYIGAMTDTAEAYEPLWWVGCYLLFVLLNALGVALTFRVTVVITLLALAVLAFFFVIGIPAMDVGRFALTSGADGTVSSMAPGSSALGSSVLGESPNTWSLWFPSSVWFPQGLRGIVTSLPFALWFYLAIEQLPLAAEDSHAPARDMPRAILLGLLTLIATAFLTLIVSACAPPGLAAIATSDEPLLDSFRALLGEGRGAVLLSLFAVAGLAASFHAIIFGYARQLFSLARAGYLPRVLSKVHATSRAPVPALLAGALLGLSVALAVRFFGGGDAPVGAVLLALAVVGAVVSYTLQMAAFIALRWRYPKLERPYRSPLGIWGAIGALLLSLLTLLSLLLGDKAYVIGTVALFAVMALGCAYFGLYSRKHLRISPEEAHARKLEGEQGHDLRPKHSR